MTLLSFRTALQHISDLSQVGITDFVIFLCITMKLLWNNLYKPTWLAIATTLNTLATTCGYTFNPLRILCKCNMNSQNARFPSKCAVKLKKQNKCDALLNLKQASLTFSENVQNETISLKAQWVFALIQEDKKIENISASVVPVLYSSTKLRGGRLTWLVLRMKQSSSDSKRSTNQIVVQDRGKERYYAGSVRKKLLYFIFIMKVFSNNI